MTFETSRLDPSQAPVANGSEFEFAPHNCFACGTLNEHGLGLQIHVEPGRSWTELELESRFEGWEGIAHGGILCTILDEVMAWALVAEDNWGVTARMSIDFKKPVPVGTRLRADGWVTHSRRRLVETEARIVDSASGAVVATATGVYVAADEERKRELQRRYGFRSLLVGACRGPAVIASAPVSATTARAMAFVADRRGPAEAFGVALSEWVNDPDSLAAQLREGLTGLADRAYLEGQRRTAPGIGALFGVRWPLLAAVQRGFRRSTRRVRPTPLLFVADRLFREPELEIRWFLFDILAQTLESDAERTWQLMRRAAREAGDWITVDSLAYPYRDGIRREPYRWAELEQLVYSPSRWERRLVGSTIATMTHGGRQAAPDPDLPRRALALLGLLIGDAEPDVQKALSWAYRSLAQLDPSATTAALTAESEVAMTNADGHRAWVIRDSLAKLAPPTADRIRGTLAGIRKRPGAPATSRASEVSTRFGELPNPSVHPDPPLT